MRYFFTSDFHLGHFNIIKYCNRPFQNLKEMDETIIARFNERVGPNDFCYYIGDFSFKNKEDPKKAEHYREQLKCKNIIFLKGNHDKRSSLYTPIHRLVIALGGHEINLTHNPEHADPSYGINFVGHIHEHWKFKRIRKGWQLTDLVNVGCDVHNFFPKTFEEIMKEYYHWRKSIK